MLTLVCQTAVPSVKHTEQNTDGFFSHLYQFLGGSDLKRLEPQNHESQAASLFYQMNLDILKTNITFINIFLIALHGLFD